MSIGHQSLGPENRQEVRISENIKLIKIDILNVSPGQSGIQQILDLEKPTIVGVGGYEDEDIDFVLSKVRGRTNPILLLHGFQESMLT